VCVCVWVGACARTHTNMYARVHVHTDHIHVYTCIPVHCLGQVQLWLMGLDGGGLQIDDDQGPASEKTSIRVFQSFRA